MPYTPGDEKKYFSKVIMILVIVALTIGGIVYYLLEGGFWDFEPLYVEVEGGIDPGAGMVPDGPPHVDPPTNPPPGE